MKYIFGLKLTLITTLFCLNFAMVAQNAQAAAKTAAKTVPGLPARMYELNFTKGEALINGEKYPAILTNGTFGAPILRANEGETLEVIVHNKLNSELSLHWHGLTVPPAMDGATSLNGVIPIPAGGDFTYRFPIKEAGTYWYHAHGGTLEQEGLYGGLVFYPPGTKFTDHDPNDQMIILSDHAKQSPDEIYEIFKTAHKKGEHENGAFYQMIANGKGDKDNLTYGFTPGQKIRLRLVNGASMTMFRLAFDNNLPMTVIAADGQPVKPVTVASLKMVNGETRDIEITPTDPKFNLLAIPYSEDTMQGMGGMGEGGGMNHANHDDMKNMEDDAADDEDMAGMEEEDPAASSESEDKAEPKHARIHFAANGKTKLAAKAKQAAKSYPELDNDALVSPVPALNQLADAARTITVRLTGDMRNYIWSINDKIFEESSPIKLAYGERIKIDFVNQSGMAHPMHLHAILFQQITKAGKLTAPRNTALVRNGETVSVVLTASERGEWLLHCHLLYHQPAGMMVKMVVE